MQCVERPRPRHLGDVRCHLADDTVEPDDPERGDVIEEGHLRGCGVTLIKQSREVATNLDDRVSRRQQRGVACQQGTGRGGVGLVNVPLQQGA
jgi:hypothetical protein